MSFEISEIVIATVVVCLLLWRVSYGTENGLFAKATGLVAVIAAFAAVYYIMNIAGGMLTSNFGNVLPKIGYLVVAFIIYSVMTALGKALRGIKDVPVLGWINRLLGGLMGVAEAVLIILLVEFVTGIQIITPMVAIGNRLWSSVLSYIQKTL